MGRRSAAPLCLLLLLSLLLGGCGTAREKTVLVIESASPAPAAEPTAAPDAAAEDLAGAWYGWWRMWNTSGDWAHMYGYYWDCCAELRGGAGVYELLLWDEDLPKDNPLSQAAVRLGEKPGCIGGSFLDRSLAEDDWTLTLREDGSGKLLTVTGAYDAVGKGGFRYEIFLRPWGDVWPGEEDELPFHYTDWYLPLIRAGADMPDTIGD